MPLYTLITQADVLNGDAKAKLAGEMTGLHSRADARHAGRRQPDSALLRCRPAPVEAHQGRDFESRAPHGLCTTLKDEVNADLAAAIADVPREAEMFSNLAMIFEWLSKLFARAEAKLKSL